MGILDQAMQPDRTSPIDPASYRNGWGNLATFGSAALTSFGQEQDKNQKHEAAMQELAARLKQLDLQAQGEQMKIGASQLGMQQKAAQGYLAAGDDASVRAAAQMVPGIRNQYGKLAGVTMPEVSMPVGTPGGPSMPVQGPAAPPPSAILYPIDQNPTEDNPPQAFTAPGAEYGGAMPDARVTTFDNPKTIAAIRNQALLGAPPAPKSYTTPAGGSRGHYDESGKWVTDFTAPYVVDPNKTNANETRKEIAGGRVASSERIAKLRAQAAKDIAEGREISAETIAELNAATRVSVAGENRAARADLARHARDLAEAKGEAKRMQLNVDRGLPPHATPVTAPYAAMIEDSAKRNGINPDWMHVLIANGELATGKTTNGKYAVSPAGAAGLTQMMPDTAKAYGVKDVNDPAQAIEGMAKYLADMKARFPGNQAHATAAYNMGPGGPWDEKTGRPGYEETRGYMERTRPRLDGNMGYVDYSKTAKAAAPRVGLTANAAGTGNEYQPIKPGMPGPLLRQRPGEAWSKAALRHQQYALKKYPPTILEQKGIPLDPNKTEDAQLIAKREAAVKEAETRDAASQGVNPLTPTAPLTPTQQGIMQMLKQRNAGGAK